MRPPKSISLLQLFIPAALLGLLAAAHSPAAPITYLVTVNTSAIHGISGFLDFDFAPGNDSQSASATIRSFSSSGALVGAPQVHGGVSGTLATSVILNNSTQFNDYLQEFDYGQSIVFVLTFGGPALDSPDGHSTSGSTFAFGLFDQTGSNPLQTTDPNGDAFTVNVNTDGTTTPTVFASAPGGASVASLTQIPEPSTLALLSLFLTGTAIAFRGRILSPR